MYQTSVDQKASPLPLVAGPNRSQSLSRYSNDPNPPTSSQHIRVEDAENARADTNRVPAAQAEAQSLEGCHANGFDNNVSGMELSAPTRTQNLASVGESGRQTFCLASSPRSSYHSAVSSIVTPRRQISSIPPKTPPLVSCNPGLEHTTRMPLSQSLGLEGCSGVFGGFVGIVGIFGFLSFLWFGCKSNIQTSPFFSLAAFENLVRMLSIFKMILHKKGPKPRGFGGSWQFTCGCPRRSLWLQ